MKRILLMVLVAATFASCQQKKTENASALTSDTALNQPAAQSSVPATDAPVIVFEKTSYDFGKIARGEKVYYSYKFTNTGKSPLIITNAEATCGCTIPEIPKEPIKPGAQGEIKVVFDSTSKMGLQDKVVTITSNAAEPMTQVHLTGEVTE
ncbi:DUF1573 domain-containing protein [Pedobacter metabolipauper]|uniref:Uncharacterized protein DUF1573 n=1 Tax=Pedobacter metabolipauper TaxID=425513 RepID=A0A4R6SRK4_9SPHI|nr:DUF1573 domain-containing protein [Pedobacter metabolipauper]TDQ07010.1 uncharacterized protein DUF1573 [Pedobacter metabolipauper]